MSRAFLLKCQAAPNIGAESKIGKRNAIIDEWLQVSRTSSIPGLINGMRPATNMKLPRMAAIAAAASKAEGFFMNRISGFAV